MKCSAELTLSAECTRPIKLTSFSLNSNNAHSYIYVQYVNLIFMDPCIVV